MQKGEGECLETQKKRAEGRARAILGGMELSLLQIQLEYEL